MFRGSWLARCNAASGSGIVTEVISPAAVESISRKIQIAVVGSGPSGCYVADFLTKKNPTIHVDLYEKLPVPFGLLRYGVAPDHPEVKNLEQKFTDLFKSNRVTWIGNVDVGKEIPIKSLLDSYTAVVVATGADNDKSLHIPGEHLGNVMSARQMVNYYNTVPFPHGSPKICPFDFGGVRDVTIIGNGNVALDVTRALSASYKYWCPTDMNCFAIKAFIQNKIRSINIVGRRGVEHSAFTIGEFRELTNFQSHNKITVRVDDFNLEEKLALPECQTRAKKRMLELVHKFVGSEKEPLDALSGEANLRKTDRGPCTIAFRYNLKPIEILPHPTRRDCVGAVRFEKCGPGSESLNDHDRFVVIPSQVVLKSVGYLSSPIRGVPFDEVKGVVPNNHGRVTDAARVYCTGWCKRGATGVIVSTMMDAQETARSILDDLENKVLRQRESEDGKFGLIDMFIAKKMFPISMAALERIWNVEKERGIDLGKRSEKINSVNDMVEIGMAGKVGKNAHNRVRGIANARPDAFLYLGELLDDETDLSQFAKELGKEVPLHLAADHEHVKPSQL